MLSSRQSGLLIKSSGRILSQKNIERKLKLTITKAVIGWREWVCLPALGIQKIKCKVDTGAKTSSLHAYDVSVFKRSGRDVVQFKVHPLQRNTKKVVVCEADLVDWRDVTDSGGRGAPRPGGGKRLQLGECLKQIEISLAARDDMGFRMLLGREAIRSTWMVDAAASFVIGKRTSKAKPKRRKNVTIN